MYLYCYIRLSIAVFVGDPPDILFYSAVGIVCEISFFLFPKIHIWIKLTFQDTERTLHGKGFPDTKGEMMDRENEQFKTNGSYEGEEKRIYFVG